MKAAVKRMAVICARVVVSALRSARDTRDRAVRGHHAQHQHGADNSLLRRVSAQDLRLRLEGKRTLPASDSERQQCHRTGMRILRIVVKMLMSLQHEILSSQVIGCENAATNC